MNTELVELVNLFDPKIQRDFEKASFHLWNNRFNISEGTWEIGQLRQDYFLEDELRESPLYQKNVEKLRQEFWKDITEFLPQYKINNNCNNCAKSRYFKFLIYLAEKVKAGEKIQLVYLFELSHAQMVQRCVIWLANQI